MSKKNVKSTDPRKTAVLAALKRRSGANKVTLVKEFFTESGDLSGHYFEGHCMKGSNRTGWESLGTVVIAAAEAGLE